MTSTRRASSKSFASSRAELKRCAAVLWTPAVVAAYEATLPQDESVSTMPSEEEVTTSTADIETEV